MDGKPRPRGSRAHRANFRVTDVSFPKAEVEALEALRMLMQQVAQIGRRLLGGGNGYENDDGPEKIRIKDSVADFRVLAQRRALHPDERSGGERREISAHVGQLKNGQFRVRA